MANCTGKELIRVHVKINAEGELVGWIKSLEWYLNVYLLLMNVITCRG